MSFILVSVHPPIHTHSHTYCSCLSSAGFFI